MAWKNEEKEEEAEERGRIDLRIAEEGEEDD